jgi:hypothetical protein
MEPVKDKGKGKAMHDGFWEAPVKTKKNSREEEDANEGKEFIRSMLEDFDGFNEELVRAHPTSHVVQGRSLSPRAKPPSSDSHRSNHV